VCNKQIILEEKASSIMLQPGAHNKQYRCLELVKLPLVLFGINGEEEKNSAYGRSGRIWHSSTYVHCSEELVVVSRRDTRLYCSYY